MPRKKDSESIVRDIKRKTRKTYNTEEKIRIVVVRFRYAVPLNNCNPKLGAMTNLRSGPKNGGRSIRSLLVKFIKTGAKIVRHSRYVTFQLAEVAIDKRLFAEILSRIERLRCCAG
ncbi:hypothetical protein ACFL6H_04965 [Candidatus Latescibacterota bacterium]